MAAHLTYQERGYCTPRGYARLDATLCLLCSLANAAIQERRDAWKMGRESIGYKEQSASLTLIRQDDPYGLGHLNVAVARGALKRVARAFGAFFRRCKAKEKPGYPRFKSARRYRTIQVDDVQPNHVQHVGNKVCIRINGLPTIRLREHRPLPPETPRTIRIVRRATGCTIDLVYTFEPEAKAPTGESVGVDLGKRKRVTLSTGEMLTEAPEDERGIRRAQRALSRSQRRSHRRHKRAQALARKQRKVAVRRRNANHRITSSLVQRFDTIVIEDLQISNMTASAKGTAEAPGRNVRAKAALNHGILQQGWGQIREQLTYKAEWAGRQLTRVPPHYTSQDCSVCGVRREKPDGEERWRCSACGTTHDRDVNGAINIHRAGISALGSLSGGRAAA